MVAICWWAPLKEMGGMLGEGLQKPAVSRNVWGVEERELSKDRRFEARASSLVGVPNSLSHFRKERKNTPGTLHHQK